MNEFLKRVAQGNVLLADGATGTNLQQAGLRAGQQPEDWVFEHPDRIANLALAFVASGADIILTCTFGGTSVRMQGGKYAGRASEMNQRAASLARDAASSRTGVLVGGSIGPLGQLLKPYGPLSPEGAQAAYAEQAKCLAEAGVDLLVVETQFSVDEARAAIAGVQSETDLPVVISFSYDRGTRTMMGVKPADVTAEFAPRQAAMIGVNCGTTLQNAEAVLQEYSQSAPEARLWAKPNAGTPRLDSSGTVYDVTPEQMAGFAARAATLGARVVGGCCGTTPEHLRMMAGAVAKFNDEFSPPGSGNTRTVAAMREAES